ncbi:MAG: hypothetical protein ACI4LO_02850 [Anaerovoracaceae bacterium]
MGKSKWLYFTMTVTIIYCALCFISAGLFLYGVYNDNRNAFDFGKGMIYCWILNPIGIIVPAAGLLKSEPKWFYILCMILTIVSWLVAGAMIAASF